VSSTLAGAKSKMNGQMIYEAGRPMTVQRMAVALAVTSVAT
jgi:hypothetical protein